MPTIEGTPAIAGAGPDSVPPSPHAGPLVTQIDFYTHVADRFETAGKLCGKAFAQKLRVLVLTPDEATSARMDRLLWSQPAIGFVPHVRGRDPLAAVTPIVVDHDPAGIDHDGVLVNLLPETPELFSRFKRVIEIVGPDELAEGRARYRFYRDRGYDIRLHDLGQTTGG